MAGSAAGRKRQDARGRTRAMKLLVDELRLAIALAACESISTLAGLRQPLQSGRSTIWSIT